MARTFIKNLNEISMQDFDAWLLKEGIDSISLNPDTVIETWLKLSKI
jgi:phosphoenolpyruvate synthase/pyruvate phosphate dikinase